MVPESHQEIMKEIQTTHTKEGVVSSDEYYTPLPLIQSLGHFDLDPCVPIVRKWNTADVMYDRNDDGLKQQWRGRIWLNPPYSAALIRPFMERMAEHNNGIALVVPKFGTKLFRDCVYPVAEGIFVMDERVKFYNQDYIQMRSPICQSVLIAYGKDNLQAILDSHIKGTMLYLKHP